MSVRIPSAVASKPTTSLPQSLRRELFGKTNKRRKTAMHRRPIRSIPSNRLPRADISPNENSAPKICIIQLPLPGPITKSDLMTPASVPPGVPGSKPKKLLDQTRDVLRLKHYSLRTERSYCDWIERFIRFHGKKTHPKEKRRRPTFPPSPTQAISGKVSLGGDRVSASSVKRGEL